MAKGTVKWFSADKGFGFIEQEGGGPDVFAHYRNIAGQGYRELQEGQQVVPGPAFRVIQEFGSTCRAEGAGQRAGGW